jgi:hypothetical protein
VAETTYRPFSKTHPEVRLIVRRVKPTPGSQLALFSTYDYHPFITDREGETIYLEADHRRHAVVEDVIRDLKYGVGVNHLPSGRFCANAVWMTLNVIAHNLSRWVGRIGLGPKAASMTTKTLRTRMLNLPGRMTTSGGRKTLHLPRTWPWEDQFNTILARLRSIPRPAGRLPARLIPARRRRPATCARRQQTMVLPALHGAWSDTHPLSPHRLLQTPRRQLRPMRDGSVPQRRSPDVFRWIRAKTHSS